MIAFLVGLIAPTVGEKFAKPLVYLGLILAAVGLFFGAKAIYDHSIISAHDTKVEASAAKADRAADQKAADQKAADEQRRNFEADQLVEAMSHAAKDPKVDDRVERNLAFHKCLSLQQRARANGLQPPRCV